MAREIEYGLEIIEIAHLRCFAHQQVMADEPGHGFGFRLARPSLGPDRARNPFAGDGVILRPALGNVVRSAAT